LCYLRQSVGIRFSADYHQQYLAKFSNSRAGIPSPPHVSRLPAQQLAVAIGRRGSTAGIAQIAFLKMVVARRRIPQVANPGSIRGDYE